MDRARIWLSGYGSADDPVMYRLETRGESRKFKKSFGQVE